MTSSSSHIISKSSSSIRSTRVPLVSTSPLGRSYISRQLWKKGQHMTYMTLSARIMPTAYNVEELHAGAHAPLANTAAVRTAHSQVGNNSIKAAMPCVVLHCSNTVFSQCDNTQQAVPLQRLGSQTASQYECGTLVCSCFELLDAPDSQCAPHWCTDRRPIEGLLNKPCMMPIT